MKYTQNLFGLYEEAFRDNFDLPALSDYGTDTLYTYRDIASEIEKLHILFDEKGVGEGSKVALIGKNSSYWCILFLATITRGAVIVPILQDFNPEDMHNIVNHSGATILFAADGIMKNLDIAKMPALTAAYPFADKGLHNDIKGNNANEGSVADNLNKKFQEKYKDGFFAKHIGFSRYSNDNLVVLNYTSGTTGFSKGVLITADNLVGNLVFAIETLDLKAGDRLVSLLPLAHAYGCAFEFLFPLLVGAHVTLLGKTPTPTVLLAAFAEVRPALIIAVPLILEKIYKRMIVPTISKPLIATLLKIPGLKTVIYNTIRKKLISAFGGNFIQVIIGGAPLNAEVEEFLLKIKFPVSVGYGMTESAPLISFSLYEDYIALSCGKILPNMEVRIDSADPQNIAGEIQVRGQNVMGGYYNNDKANENIFSEDGWLRTGDLGTVDTEGNIFIRGRSKNMILSANGQNIYPEEIEAKLDNLPFVSESLVVNRNGKLVALVVPDTDALKKASISKDGIDKIMKSNLLKLNAMVASYEKVAEIEIRETEFEKTPKKSIKRYLYS